MITGAAGLVGQNLVTLLLEEGYRNIVAIDKHRTNLATLSTDFRGSVADDNCTNSKKRQEQLVLESGLRCCVLRPTLMFGWFDTKRLGWLARFMERVPVFPIPGHGRYMRQPLS